MNLKKEGQDAWNKAYDRGGNIVFYPHEEVIRFINKYIRKRTGISTFANVMNISDEEWVNFASLDLGCGIGRHVNFLDEFNLNPYGIDLSDTAIFEGQRWLKAINKEPLIERLIVGSVANLPFKNDFFNICVSHGVLDSMPRDIAIKGFDEVYRVLKKDGMMYVDFILGSQIREGDKTVKSGYEEGTIQSYFTIDSIKDFIGDRMKILEFKVITWEDDKGKQLNRRAHIIIQKR